MKFRKFLAITLMLGTIASNTLISVEAAEIEFLGSGNYSIGSDRVTGNYYLKEKINKGFEFTPLSDERSEIYVNSKGESYLVTGEVEESELETLGLMPSMQPFAFKSIYAYDNGRKINGQWEGGISGLTVQSTTMSTTSDSQGRASVTVNGTIYDAGWRDEYIYSSISRNIGLSGGLKANWDLRSRI